MSVVEGGTGMREPAIGDYQGDHGSRVLTWDQLTALYNEFLPNDGELGELLVAIQLGDASRARDACACLLAGDRP